MANLFVFKLICLVCLFSYANMANTSLNSEIGLEFNYPKFQASEANGVQPGPLGIDGIRFVGDAVLSDNVVQLTNNNSAMYKHSNQSWGGIVYNEKIQLSAITNFTTHFVFSMDSDKNLPAGDGIVFFLSSPSNISQFTNGGQFGTIGNNTNGSLHFFAVVFSNLQQTVGILIDDSCYLKSTSALGISNGILRDAWIDYNCPEVRVYLSSGSSSLKSPQNCILTVNLNFSVLFSGNASMGFSSAARNPTETHNIFSWSFNSTLNSETSGMSSNEKGRKELSSNKKILMAVGCGVVACISGLLWGHFCITRRKRAESIIRAQKWACVDIDKLLYHIPRQFKLDDLVAGTKNFSEALKLGQGGFGGVYKCNLVQTNEIVAVKRMSEGSRQGVKEFISEVSIVSRLRHRNLVQLVGWCHEQNQLLLVYEYLSNGSLDRHIFTAEGEELAGEDGEEPAKVLEWSTRYKIATEIASALLYLHEEWDECVVHRDVKSTNILLDSNFSPKIGDFGLARMLRHDRLAQTTRAAGTMGYLAPECVVWGKTSPQSDVYSFGAVALEIASGKQAIDLSLVEFGMRLVAWAWEMYGQGRLLEVADARLNGVFKKEEMERLIVVGLWSSHPDAASRPNMRQVVRLLNFEVAAPVLPAALPVPSYGHPSITTGPSVPVQSITTSLSPR